MSYYFAKTLAGGFDDAIRRTTEALKQEGFGIITEIDVKDTFKKKINVDFRNYRILGACNPTLAHEALQLEDKVGTMPRAMWLCRTSAMARSKLPPSTQWPPCKQSTIHA